MHLKVVAFILAIFLVGLIVAVWLQPSLSSGERDILDNYLDEQVARNFVELDDARVKRVGTLDAKLVVRFLEEIVTDPTEEPSRINEAYLLASYKEYASTYVGGRILMNGLESKDVTVRMRSTLGLVHVPDSIKKQAGEALLQAYRTEASEMVKNTIAGSLSFFPHEAEKEVDTFLEDFRSNPRSLDYIPITVAYVTTPTKWLVAMKSLSDSNKLVELKDEQQAAVLASVYYVARLGKFSHLTQEEQGEVIDFTLALLKSEEKDIRQSAFDSLVTITMVTPIGSEFDKSIVQAWTEQMAVETNPTLKSLLESHIEHAIRVKGIKS